MMLLILSQKNSAWRTNVGFASNALPSSVFILHVAFFRSLITTISLSIHMSPDDRNEQQMISPISWPNMKKWTGPNNNSPTIESNEISSINAPKKNASIVQSLFRIPNGRKNGIWYVSSKNARESPQAKDDLPSRKTPDRKHQVNYPNWISMSCQRGLPATRAKESKWRFLMTVSNGTTRTFLPTTIPRQATISMTTMKTLVHATILPMRTSEKHPIQQASAASIF